MLKKIILAYYRRYPTPQMIDDLQVDYIHPPHGIDHTNHTLPHSHLWDQLDWETIPFNDQECVMYIRLMDNVHLETLIERGKAVRFHIHGAEGATIEQERAYMAQQYFKVKRKVADWLFTAGIIMAAAGITIILAS